MRQIENYYIKRIIVSYLDNYSLLYTDTENINNIYDLSKLSKLHNKKSYTLDDNIFILNPSKVSRFENRLKIDGDNIKDLEVFELKRHSTVNDQ